MIIRTTLFGSPNVGLYSIASDKFLILPKAIPDSEASMFEKYLKVKVVKVNIIGTFLNGVVSAANSKGILLPHLSMEDKEIRKALPDVRVGIIKCKKNALGNLVLTNDKGAIVSREFPPEVVKEIGDTLDVEVEKGTIAGLPLVGSFAIATNKGVLAYKGIRDEEKSLIEDVLKVKVGLGTVNGGVSFVKSGIIANSYGAATGMLTTGPELINIGRVLQVL